MRGDGRHLVGGGDEHKTAEIDQGVTEILNGGKHRRSLYAKQK
jgi:hypothetical protein